MTRTNIKELAQQRFIATPKLLLYGQSYTHLSGNAFKTYVALYDRFTLSIQNNWIDEEHNVYFVYDLEDLQNITKIGKKALYNAREQLKEAKLLEEVSTGRNNRLYLSLPTPANEEEAKYIIADEMNQNLKDTSSWTDEERKAKSESMKNKAILSDSAKGTIVQQSQSYQQFDENQNQAIVRKELSDSAKGTTNDTNLIKLSKDIKDDKDQADVQNQQIVQQFSNNEKSYEQDLITQYVEENDLTLAYGVQTLQLIQNYAFKDFAQFKVYVDKFYYAWHSAEKDLDDKINPYEQEALHKELASTFKRVIMQFKQGKTNNINNYLYISIKNVFLEFGANLKAKQDDLPPVPLDNWLK